MDSLNSKFIDSDYLNYNEEKEMCAFVMLEKSEDPKLCISRNDGCTHCIEGLKEKVYK
jgi:hypothetical protein